MRVGFVGYGSQSQENLIPCCRTLPAIDIAAVCDKSEVRRSEAASVFGEDKVYSNFSSMIDRCHLDAVVVACYPDDHYHIAMQAMDKRLPIFIEKPPAPSSLHLSNMIDMAERSQCTTGVGMNFRYATVTRRLKGIAPDGIDSICLRHFCNKPTGPLWGNHGLLKSFLYAQTIHSVDFLIYLLGPVSDVAVVGDVRESALAMTVSIQFVNGASATLVTSNSCPHFVFDFDAIAIGSKLISSSALWNLQVSEIGKTYINGEAKRWSDTWAHSPLESGFMRSGYAGQMIDFFAAVAAGRQSTSSFASLVETYRCLDAIEAQLSDIVPIAARKVS